MYVCVCVCVYIYIYIYIYIHTHIYTDSINQITLSMDTIKWKKIVINLDAVIKDSLP